MDRLDVQTSRLQPAAAALAGLIMVPLGVVSVITGLRAGAIAPVGIGVAMLALFGLVVWLGRRAHGRSVRYFSPEGLQRNDGKFLAWADLDRVVYQIRENPPGKKKLWRTEVRFRNGGAAWLLPLRVRNARDVSEYLGGLPCEHAEEQV